MKISAGLFTDPARNGFYTGTATAVSLFVFAYSTLFGAASILLFYALWAPVLLLPTQRLLRQPLHFVPVLLLPAFALASVLWSDRPDTTLRAALQWSSTVVLGLAAARVTTTRTLAAGLLVGGLAVLAYSAINGSNAYDVVDGSYAFAGAFGSKNQLGLFASITLIAATYPLVTPRASGWLWVTAALAIGAFATSILIRTESATSVITVVLAFALILFALGVLHLPRLWRVMLLAAGGLLLVVGIGVAIKVGALDVLFSIFGKDATLTGRTYLWSRGIEFARADPVFGSGYNAFWVIGRAEAEELWNEFHIIGQSGFHFHNALIEIYVGLGLTGVSLLAVWCVLLFALPLVAVLQTENRSTSILAGLSLLFLVRSFAEIDFLTPYTAGSFLVPALLLAMLDNLNPKRLPPQPRTRPHHGTQRHHLASRPAHSTGATAFTKRD